MNFLRFRVITLSLVSFLATAAYAVEQLPEKEEDIPVEYIATYDNTVSVGLRHTSGKAKVKFGNIGVAHNKTEEDFFGRYYSNGAINLDYAGNMERDYTTGEVNNSASFKNANGTLSVRSTDATSGAKLVTVYTNLYAYTGNATDGYALTVVDGNYVPQKDANGKDNPASTYKFLAYETGQTRNWEVKNASQVHKDTGTVEMTTYATSSAGATAEAEGGSSSGFEITLERRLLRFGKLEVGFSGGLSLADINMKNSSVVLANKLETTDIYTAVHTGLNADFFSTTSPTITSQPSGSAQSLKLLDQNGVQMYNFVDASTLSSSYDGADVTTVTPLLITPASQGTQKMNGTVLVRGTWQVKGAYYQMKVGPTFRYRFNDRWAVSGGFGLSMCYAGTVFKADEEILEMDGETLLFHPQMENNTHKFVPGYYGDLNMELWVTERSGFYAGVNYQNLGNYTQTPLFERTAKIDLGTSMGWRLGIMTRF